MPRRFGVGDYVVLDPDHLLERNWDMRDCLGVVLDYGRAPYFQDYYRLRETGQHSDDVPRMSGNRYSIAWFPPLTPVFIQKIRSSYWLGYDHYLTWERSQQLKEPPENILNSPEFAYVPLTETIAPALTIHDVNTDSPKLPTVQFHFVSQRA